MIRADRLKDTGLHTGASRTVLKAEQLAQRPQIGMADVLRLVPGIDVVRNGGFGGLVSVFSRGTESDHMLILLDGLRLNDPTSGLADLSLLGLNEVERIEIVRGPRSLLYGSEALGGVIRISTRRPAALAAFRGRAEIGPYDSRRAEFGLTGQRGHLGYALQFSQRRQQGFSAVNVRGGGESDGIRHRQLGLRMNWHAHSGPRLQTSLLQLRSQTEIDDFMNAPQDDPDYLQRNRNLLMQVRASWDLAQGAWQQYLEWSRVRLRSRFLNGPQAPNCATCEDFLDFNSIGLRHRYEWQHTLHLAAMGRLNFGLLMERERATAGPTRSVRNRRGARLNWQREWEWLSVEGSLMHDAYPDDNQVSGHVALTVPLNRKMRLHGSIGTGYRAPGLNELHDPRFGNPELRPERSVSGDLGLDLQRGPVRFSSVVFYQRTRDLINFDLNFRSVNIGNTVTQGYELSFDYAVTPGLHARLDYTRTDARDRSNGESLARRPGDKLNLGLEWSPLRQLRTSLTMRHVGSRPEIGTDRPILGSYIVVDMAAYWRILPDWELFFRVENLLDRQYQEIQDYGTPGLSLYGGIRFQFLAQ